MAEKTILDLFKLLFPLSRTKKAHLTALKKYLEEDEIKYARYLLKLGRMGVSYDKLNISKNIAYEKGFPQIHKAVPDEELDQTINLWNDNIRKVAEEELFHEFSTNAAKVIPSVIAPQIIGFEDIKNMVSWQLFCPEGIHVLLLGDPGTGKTDILRGAAQLAPISSFGLGSGTSGVGLTGAMKGKKFVKGLLPAADKGVCCIDELNLMRPRDRGALLNAMEKGFVTYDKGTSHKQLPAKVRILATANPKGDRFIGSKAEFLREQLPFDPALLSRFHAVFLIRRPDMEEFMRITKSIITKRSETLRSEDVKFIRDYIKYAEKMNVEFDPKLEPVVTDFVEEVKVDENKFLVELSPRFVLGIVRLTKAVARMHLSPKVTHEHLALVLRTIKRSLYFSTDSKKKHRKS